MLRPLRRGRGHGGQAQQERHRDPPGRARRDPGDPAGRRPQHGYRREDAEEHREPLGERPLHVTGVEQERVPRVLLVPGLAAADEGSDARRLEHRGQALVRQHQEHRRGGGREHDHDESDPPDLGRTGPQRAQHRNGSGQERREGHQAARRDGGRHRSDQQAHHQREEPPRGHRPLHGDDREQQAQAHPRLRAQADGERQEPRQCREGGQPPDASPGTERAAARKQPRDDETGQDTPTEQGQQHRRQPHPCRRGGDARPGEVQVVEPAERRLRSVQPAVDVADEARAGPVPHDAGDVAVIDRDGPDDPPERHDPADHQVRAARPPPGPGEQPG
ncbi:MAG: hypothetical protein QOJ30_3121, partial [Pseudonocardiales bacterium]|nr:hypothetical protein [Pseudonocardiales bacterium]